MNDPSLAQHETKRLDELHRGDWIHADFEDFIDAAAVVHVETYPSDSWGVGTILLYRAVGDTSIHTARCAAESPIRMLTEAELADAMDDERRELIAARLGQIADLVRRKTTPLPSPLRAVEVRFDFRDDTDALAAFAEAIGAEVAEYAPDYARVVTLTALQRGADDRSAGVDLFGQATRPKNTPAPEPTADPTGLLHSRADEADDPTPVSPARAPMHVGDAESHITDDGRREDDETPVPVEVPPTDPADLPGWRDEATGLVSGGLVPSCPTCGGDHHTAEPCR